MGSQTPRGHGVTWEILIATLCSRTKLLQRLLDVLLPQVDAVDGQVRVTAYRNQGERPLGQIRQALLDHADAQYVCFIDDDDLVHRQYVETVLPLLDGVDYIGWQQQLFINGRKADRVTYHSLRYREWIETPMAWFRDVTHLNPIRLELARKARFDQGSPEDYNWVRAVRPYVETEHYIEGTCMYYYLAEPLDSSWTLGTVRHLAVEYPPRPPESPVPPDVCVLGECPS